MPLADFLAQFHPAYYDGQSWNDIAVTLNNEPSEHEVITNLREVIKKQSDFDEAVMVDPESKQVTNGMHRISAHILENSPSVTYATKEPEEDTDQVVSVYFTVAPAVIGGPSAPDDFYDWIRSFPLKDTWVTSDVFGTINGVSEGHWYCPTYLSDVLVQTIIARMAKYCPYVKVSIVSVAHGWDTEE